MEKNQKSDFGIIEKLALVTDAIQNTFPEGKVICVYQLNETDFKSVQENFRKIDHVHKRFSINISEIEHVFIEDVSEQTEQKPIEISFKKSFLKKILSMFKSS